MSFEDEIKQATNAIEGLARTQLRNRFPYMNVEALEKSLTKTGSVLASGLVEQKKEICAAQSRTSFMSLSAELRNMIYEMALRVEGTVDVFHKPGVCHHTMLLLTNRQVYEEARPIWYSLNTFEFQIGYPVLWPRPQGPESDFDSPRSVSKWLETLGSGAAMVKSITMDIWASDTPGSALSEILRFAGRGLELNGLTVHQGVLQASGLLDRGVSPEAFTFLFRDRLEAAIDLYEAAGFSGEDVLTEELIKRLR